MATKKISDLQLISAMADDVNIPGENTSQTYRVTGAQLKTYIQAQIADLMKQAKDLYNLGLLASVSGNALTIALKQLDGSTDATTAAPVRIGFRGTTAANGDSSLVSATGAISTVISSGSTAGFSNAIAAKLYVYALNNGGTIELAWAGCPFDEGSLQSTTAEGGAGAADSGIILYSTTARSNKAIRLIGIITATEATAGTWATAPSEVRVASSGTLPVRVPTVQRFTSGSGNYTVPTPAPLYLKVKMVGGGGGGGGGGTTSGTAASAGGNTTFGTSLLTANGGTAGARGIDGPTGGTATVAAPGISVVAVTGGAAAGGSIQGSITTDGDKVGGQGGGTCFGCGGGGGTGNGNGIGRDAPANTGAGGGGACAVSGTASAQAGSGGAGGAYIEAIIPNPAAGNTYAYAVGASGTGQIGGTNGQAGGAGGSGVVIVEEHYQ